MRDKNDRNQSKSKHLIINLSTSIKKSADNGDDQKQRSADQNGAQTLKLRKMQK